jgi:predicted metalloprotease
MPMGRTGDCLIGWALGINPLDLIEGQIGSGSSDTQQQSQPAPGQAETQAPSDQMGQFVAAVLGSTEVQWKEIFAAAGKKYEPPTLVMFSGATRSACGFAQAAMGPFYCPNVGRSNSTPRSSRTSSGDSAAARSEARAASSPRPM